MQNLEALGKREYEYERELLSIQEHIQQIKLIRVMTL